MNRQEHIKNLLESGKFTAVELNRMANTGDARKYISESRANFRDGISGGADVQDECRYHSDGVLQSVLDFATPNHERK